MIVGGSMQSLFVEHQIDREIKIKENEDFDSKSAQLIFEGWYNQNYG